MLVPTRTGGGSPIALAALLATAAGCVHHLPPPDEPGRELPEATRREALATPATPRRAPIALDIVDGSGTIEDVGVAADGAHARTICEATPCVAVLAVGEHRLVMHQGGRDDEVTVRVGPGARAHRHVMSYDSGEHREYLTLAAAGYTIGLGLLPILGPAVAIDPGDINLPDLGIIAATGVMAAAIVTGTVGLVLSLVDPQSVRDGVSIEWDLAP